MSLQKNIVLFLMISLASILTANVRAAAQNKSWIIEAGGQTLTIDWVRGQQRPFSIEIASDLEIEKGEAQSNFRRSYTIAFNEPWELWITGSDSVIGNFSFDVATTASGGMAALQAQAAEERGKKWRNPKSAKIVIRYLTQPAREIAVSSQGETVVKLVDAKKNVERSYSIKFAPRQLDIVLGRATGPVPIGVTENQNIPNKPSHGEKIIIFDTNDKKK